MNEDIYLVILGVIVVILFVALIILTYKVFDIQQKVTDGNKRKIHEEKPAQTKTEQKTNTRKNKLLLSRKIP